MLLVGCGDLIGKETWKMIKEGRNADEKVTSSLQRAFKSISLSTIRDE